jgi:hypothetical protein
MHVCTYVCMHVYACFYAYIHMFVRTYTYLHVRICHVMNTYSLWFTSMCIHAYMHVHSRIYDVIRNSLLASMCIDAFMKLFACAGIGALWFASMCIHAYMKLFACAGIGAYVCSTDLQSKFADANSLTVLAAHKHTCAMHKCTNTHRHTYIQVS